MITQTPRQMRRPYILCHQPRDHHTWKYPVTPKNSHTQHVPTDPKSTSRLELSPEQRRSRRRIDTPSARRDRRKNLPNPTHGSSEAREIYAVETPNRARGGADPGGSDRAGEGGASTH
jgi:hypothetical protein